MRAVVCLASGSWLVLATGGFAAEKSQADASPSAADHLFGELRVLRFKIALEKPAQQSLKAEPYQYVPAQIEAGGAIYPNVGLHLKGALTFRLLSEKPGLTLKFNEYLPGQAFHGLRKILLNNAKDDPTYVQERLGQDLFRAAGAPSPRVNYARVELNGRDLGLYVLVEGITKDFLERHFGAAKGNLYEGVEEDIDERLEQDFGERSRYEDLRPLIAAVRQRDRQRRFQELERCLNVDQFVSYLALETMMDVWDGYSLRRNNYRVYCDAVTGRATFIPHGLDNFFVEADAPLFPRRRGVVSAALLDTPEGRRRFIARMTELSAGILRKESVHRRIDEIVTTLKPELTALGLEKSHAKALAIFRTRIDRRLDFLEEELRRLRAADAPPVKTGR